MLAYMHLMVREGHKHGGTGWLKYDGIFWNNAGPSASWDVLDLFLLTIAANQGYTPVTTARSWITGPVSVLWPPWSSQPRHRRKAGSQATSAIADAHTPLVVLVATLTAPLIIAVRQLVELIAHAYVSHGIRDSAHSKGSAHMLTSVPHVTADLTRHKAVPGTQHTRTLRR